MHETVSMQGRKNEMATKVFVNGLEHSHTSITIPRHVRDEARSRRINMSRLMTETLLQKFREQDQEREL